MSILQSKEFFKKKQSRRNKETSLGGKSGITISESTTKSLPIRTSQGNTSDLLGNDDDPALVVINPILPNSSNQTKGKRTKFCCLL